MIGEKVICDAGTEQPKENEKKVNYIVTVKEGFCTISYGFNELGKDAIEFIKLTSKYHIAAGRDDELEIVITNAKEKEECTE